MFVNINSITLTNANSLKVRSNVMKKETTSLAEETELFLKYLLPVKKHLYNFIRKSMNFSPESDDVFQDTLLKSFRYLYSFDRNRNFKTWIFSIAYNLTKDAFRKKEPFCYQISIEETKDFENIANQKEIAVEVLEIYAAAAKLSPRQRRIFFLYYYNEFDISEIVKITGLTRANIKFILYQSRKVIKRVLEVQA